MSSGSLIFPVGYVPLDDNGSPVAAGKLNFYRTGTTTPQNTYSDSTLTTPNANPVVLDSAGRATTAIYGDSASGYDYRVQLTTSADVQIFQFDDVKVDGANSATIAEGSFTGAITGCTAAVSPAVTYDIVQNSQGTGKVCTLLCAVGATGTSNTTAMTMTGLPSACQPSTAIRVQTTVRDNGSDYNGEVLISAAGSTITFTIDQPYNPSGFTNSGTKGIPGGWSVTYPL